jgi:hypothetical protein
MKKDEVIKIIEGSLLENGMPEDQITEGYDGYALEEYFEYSDVKPFNGYTIQEIEHFGGEGQGDEMWKVFSISKDGEKDAYFRVQGFYNSWNGTEWNYEIDLVQPYEVTVTQWRKENA